MTPVFRHGRLRLYLLRLLDEEPRHGYEVIRLLRDRFMGVYAPSPGTIYPRLARLEEEGLVTHDEENGRKVYRITEAGREELRKRGDELNELEQELSASVSDIVREVKEDVRETVRNLREELTKAAREMRAGLDVETPPAQPHETHHAPAAEAASGKDDARSARGTTGQPRQPLGSAPLGGAPLGGASLGGASLGNAWAQAREQARLLREQAARARDHARHARDGALGQAAQRIREEAASLREDLGSHDWGGEWASWADWAGWADWPGRKGQPLPHDMAAFRDLERLARGFANDLRKVAWDSGALGGDVLATLHEILDDALDRIKDEVRASSEESAPADPSASGQPSAPSSPDSE
ncbi:MAG TPA: helix-turn-helix transcriptional regulator [Trebonia sp.]|nr:helix-turn-helix transcriptional regulator [Trebonia sp.]